jgi:hypothetical protein
MTHNFDARILVMRFAYGPLFEARGCLILYSESTTGELKQNKSGLPSFCLPFVNAGQHNRP